MLSLLKVSLFLNVATTMAHPRYNYNRRYLSSNSSSNTTESTNATSNTTAATSAPTTTAAPPATPATTAAPKVVKCPKGFATYEKDNTCPKDYESVLPKCQGNTMRKNKDGKCPTGTATAAPSSSRLLEEQEQDDLNYLRLLSEEKKHPECECFPTTAAPTTAAPSSRLLEEKMAEIDRLLAETGIAGGDIDRVQRLLSSGTTAAPAKKAVEIDHCVCKEKADKTTAAPKTDKTAAPKTDAPTTAEPAEALNTTAIPEGTKFEVMTTVSADIEIDLTGMNTTQKTGLAQGLAFGLHEAACNGVTSMWTNVTNCMLGEGIDDVSFGMAMGIDTDLVATQPTVSEYLSANRRLSSTTTKLENKGDFKVIAPSAQVAATATNSIQTAVASGGLTAANIKASLTQALQARASTIGADALAKVVAAVAIAVVKTTEPVTVTVPPVVATTATPATSTSGSVDELRRGMMALLLGGVMFLFTC